MKQTRTMQVLAGQNSPGEGLLWNVGRIATANLLPVRIYAISARRMDQNNPGDCGGARC